MSDRLVTRPIVRWQKNTVRDQVPHMRVGIIMVLLHAKAGLSQPILPKFRVLELSQELFDRSRTVSTFCPGTAIISASMSMNLLAFNVA